MLIVLLLRTLPYCATSQFKRLSVHGAWGMVCGAQGYCQGDMAGLDSGPWWNCTVCSLEEPDSLIDKHSMLRHNRLRQVQAVSTGSCTIQSSSSFLHFNAIQHVIIVAKKKWDDKKNPCHILIHIH